MLYVYLAFAERWFPLRPNDSLNRESGRTQFIKYFGKPIEEYESFKRASSGLADSYMRNCRRVLPYYFLFLKMDPDAVIAQRKKDIVAEDAGVNERFEILTKTYIKELQARNLAGKTLRSHLSRVQGFYRNNGKRLSLDMPRMRISKARKKRKYSPSNEEVRLLFSKADCALHRLIVALLFQHGPAPIDASLLCVGSYPSEPWQYFEFSRSKTGEVWRGVSTPDVCQCLREYLVVRGKVDVGERLLVGREGPLNGAGVSQIVRELIVKAGLDKVVGFKPTSLRDAFEDALVDSQVYPKIKKALMGHTVDIEAEYGGFNKMVGHLAEAMKKVYPLICLCDLHNPAELAGFSAEDVSVMKDLLKRKDKIVRVFDLLDRGELVNVHDPDLPERLKKMEKKP